MNKLLIGIIIVVVVIGAIAVMSSSKKTQQQPINSNYNSGSEQTQQSGSQPGKESNKSVIDVTTSGFSPNALTVKAGAMVEWNNKSGSTISINSADHPTHKLYPQLNIGEIANGTATGLIFDKPGTYMYHDHYNPSMTGTIVVE